MPEKTMKNGKSIILLRSFCLMCLTIAVIFCMVCPTFAEEINYRDYETKVKVDGDNDIVTVEFPTEWIRGMIGTRSGTGLYKWNGAVLDTYLNSVPDEIRLYCAPFGTIFSRYTGTYNGRYLSLDNIPSDSEFTIQFGYGGNASSGIAWGSADERFYSVNDTDAEYYFKSVHDLGGEGGTHYYTFSSTVSTGSGKGWFPMYIFTVESLDDNFYGDHFYLEVTKFQLEISISSLYRLQEQSGITNELLTEVNRQLEEQGKTLDEVLEQQQQTNEKLDELPGEIGDEVQGVIDSEKEESKEEGNKFVDQILDALPDPSTEVLGALKSLTDSTAYTGTDAVLPIPAIVLPGIDGLFPETEIWGGTDFDFGEYIELLPPTLLTLVRALFTIAIVIFCVYELKGIISYCLTLRENKGG